MHLLIGDTDVAMGVNEGKKVWFTLLVCLHTLPSTTAFLRLAHLPCVCYWGIAQFPPITSQSPAQFLDQECFVEEAVVVVTVVVSFSILTTQ